MHGLLIRRSLSGLVPQRLVPPKIATPKLVSGSPTGPAPTPAIHGLKAPCFRGKNASAGPVLGLTGGLFLIRYTLDYQLHLTPQKQRALEPGGDRDEAEEGVVIPNECPRVYIQMHTIFLITRRRDAAPHRLPPALRAHPAAPSRAWTARSVGVSLAPPAFRHCAPCTRPQVAPASACSPPFARLSDIDRRPSASHRRAGERLCIHIRTCRRGCSATSCACACTPSPPPPFIAAPLIARAINPEDLSFTRI
ncbi:hypothetical protein DFH09DRAFT_1328546 [Mycena vulgaris]|nr:hypothetical protein DFH09DRAFT_1328546 [Mycena vulgaris]